MTAPLCPIGLGGPAGGIPCGLVLHLRVEFGATQQDDDGNPGPDHEPDDGAQCAVGRVVIGKILQVVGKGRGSDDPDKGSKRCTPGQPAQLRRFTAWPVPVDQRDPSDGGSQQHRPASPTTSSSVHGPRLKKCEDGWHDADRHDEGDANQDRADGEDKGQQVKPDEAALLVLVVSDVQAVKQGLDAAVRAPQCDTEAEQETHTRGFRGPARQARATGP